MDWAQGWQWQLDAQAQEVDPALLWPDWAGSLSAQVHSQGGWQEDRTEGRLQLRELRGRLQSTPLAGEVELHWQARDQAQLSAALQVGEGRLRGDLSLADELQGEWRLQDWELAVLRLPGLPMQGRIDAHIGVSGTPDAPRLDVDAQGRDLALSGFTAKSLSGRGRLGWGGDAPLRFDLSGSDLSASDQTFSALNVPVQGQQSAQQWQARLQTAQGELRAQAHGGGDWRDRSGTLDSGQVSSVNPRWASWNLRQEVALRIGDTTRIAPLCIDNGAEARLCAQVELARRGCSHRQHAAQRLAVELAVGAALARATRRLYGLPLGLIFTKLDKANSPKSKENIELFQAKMLENWEVLPPSFATSAFRREGKEALLDYLDSCNKQLLNNKWGNSLSNCA